MSQENNMSIKNSQLQKMARREWKKMAIPSHERESKWILTYNRYGYPDYKKIMVPVNFNMGGK